MINCDKCRHGKKEKFTLLPGVSFPMTRCKLKKVPGNCKSYITTRFWDLKEYIRRRR